MTSRDLLTFLLLTGAPAWGADPSDDLFDLEHLRVRIAETLPYAQIRHGDRKVLLMRHQDGAHRIEAPFDRTSRDCPPFCIQPMQLHPGVETIGELELIGYLQRVSRGDPGVLVVDSRTATYANLGTIPGSVNIPFTRLDPIQADPEAVSELLQLEFGALYEQGLWDFTPAKTLVLFCNGPWCGQSPANIKALLRFGYPADKIKWYRGGLQSWEQFGLTTVKPGAQ